MPFQKDLPQCGFMGCPRPQHDGHTYVFEAPTVKVIPICLYHEAMIDDPNVTVDIGLTVRGEAEIRVSVTPKPAEPTPPE